MLLAGEIGSASGVAAMGAGLRTRPTGRDEPPDPKVNQAARGVATPSGIEPKSAEVLLPIRTREGSASGRSEQQPRSSQA